MEKPKLTLSTVDRALELADILAHNNKMSAIEISNALGINRTGAYALLNSMMRNNFVEKDTASGKYSLGYKFLELGSYYRYQYPFVTAAERGIYSISRKYKCQINLIVYKSPCTALLLLIKAPEDRIRSAQSVTRPAHITAGGKLLMAYLPQEKLEREINYIDFVQYARNTIMDRETLLKRIEEIRSKGYSIEIEEGINQTGCVAAPIRTMSGDVIASISLMMSAEEMKKNINEYLEVILNTAKDISIELGYNPYNK